MTPAEYGGRGSIFAGIAFMLAGVVCMVGLDVTAKWLLQDYALTQLVFLRCMFSILLVAAYGLSRGGPAGLRTRRPLRHFVRSLLMAGSMFAFFHALRVIPLADVMALAFAAPLIVTALSQPLLGEPVGPWRWAAVITGFAGVLVVLRPGIGVVQPAALLALTGAVFYALMSVTARRYRRSESPVSLTLYAFLVPCAIGAFQAPSVWQPPPPADWLLFAACGCFGGMAFVFINAALGRAPAAVIVPFEYTGLIWAALAGFVIWGEVPGMATWAGAAIIMASGLFILYRETAAHRAAAALDFPLQEAVAVETEDG